MVPILSAPPENWMNSQNSSNIKMTSQIFVPHRVFVGISSLSVHYISEESAVKSVKFHLKRIVGNVKLTFEESTTVGMP